MKSRRYVSHQTGRHGAGVSLGSCNIIGRTELRDLLEDCQRALAWSDYGLAHAAGITVKMVRYLKQPLHHRLIAPGPHLIQPHQGWTRREKDAIEKITAALERKL